jgi:hypothetical protein
MIPISKQSSNAHLNFSRSLALSLGRLQSATPTHNISGKEIWSTTAEDERRISEEKWTWVKKETVNLKAQ